MTIIWVLRRSQNREISKDAQSISSYVGDFSITYINRGIISIKAIKRELEFVDLGTAPRGFPQLQSMGAVIHGEVKSHVPFLPIFDYLRFSIVSEFNSIFSIHFTNFWILEFLSLQ